MHGTRTSRSARRLPAVGATVALATAVLVTLGAPAAHAATGAVLPFTSVEAESATTNGTRIGPDYTRGSLASEASGRQAVRLSAGQRVEFTAPRAANAVNVSYNVPRRPVRHPERLRQRRQTGRDHRRHLQVLSRGHRLDRRRQDHHFYDNARLLLGQNVQAGDKIAVEAANVQATVDVADFEQVAPAATQPAGSVSVTAKGAAPSGRGDSTQAFRDAVDAARGGVAWIPPGDYRLTSSLGWPAARFSEAESYATP